MLVERGPGRYHYVVPVAWHDDTVLLHDPTRGPFVVREADAFVEAWAAAGFWTMLVLPGAADGTPDAEAPVPTPVVAPAAVLDDTCDGLVPRAVALARAGDQDGAAAVLAAAATRCPGLAAIPREQAGLRFLDRDFEGAAALAARAVDLAPADTHAWRVLAASRFLRDEGDGALKAWNAAGEPRVDRVRLDVHGPTTALTVREAAGLRPGDLLTPERLRLARRRVGLLPGAATARVSYVPGAEGRADLDVALRERGSAWSVPALAQNAVRALAHQSVRLDHPLTSGARVRTDLRWQTGRPQVALGLDLPRLFGRAGAWSVDATWSRQAYAAAATSTLRRAEVRYTSWVAPDTRLSAGVGLTRWMALGSYLTVAGALDQRAVGDLVALQVGGSLAPAVAGGRTFGRVGVLAAWRSATQAPRLSARAGLDVASSGAPADAWPRAGTGVAAPVLVRAHPLLENGAAGGPLLGRRLAHAGIEAEAPLGGPAPLRLGLAVFADLGRAWRPLDSDPDSRTQVDVGVGLAVHAPGLGPALRLDVARGLRDGAHALTVRWQAPWPGEPPGR
jgi:hypothetical protein